MRSAQPTRLSSLVCGLKSWWKSDPGVLVEAVFVHSGVKSRIVQLSVAGQVRPGLVHNEVALESGVLEVMTVSRR